jgi:hypothetical protein
MQIGPDHQRWHLAAGDCLALRLDAPLNFHNPGPRAARYLVALTGAAS